MVDTKKKDSVETEKVKRPRLTPEEQIAKAEAELAKVRANAHAKLQKEQAKVADEIAKITSKIDELRLKLAPLQERAERLATLNSEVEPVVPQDDSEQG